MKKNIITGTIAILIYILIMEILPIFLSDVVEIILKNIYSCELADVPLKAIIYANNLFNLFIYILLFIPIVLLYRKSILNDLKEFSNNYKFYLKKFFTFYLIFYIANYIVAIITTIMSIDSSQNQETILVLTKYNKVSFLLMYLTAGILGPIVEELIFRRAIFAVAVNKWVGLICSTFLFGLIHILTTSGSITDKLLVGLPYFSSGFVFGLAYIKSNRNIAITIAIHAISNITSLFLIFIIT